MLTKGGSVGLGAFHRGWQGRLCVTPLGHMILELS